MSLMGQSRRFALPLTTSGLPQTADITHRDHHLRKVPTTEVADSTRCHPSSSCFAASMSAVSKPSDNRLKTGSSIWAAPARFFGRIRRRAALRAARSSQSWRPGSERTRCQRTIFSERSVLGPLRSGIIFLNLAQGFVGPREQSKNGPPA
jgi:hypothetical protein